MVGYILPAVTAFPAFSYISRSLGVEQFGLFLLSMSILGYAGIFDGGLTRAIIRDIAIYKYDIEEKYKIIATTTLSISLFGCGGAVVFLLGTPFLTSWLNVSAGVVTEFNKSLIILLLNLPLCLVNQVWLSILEGEEQFCQLNIQRTIIGVLLFGFPAIFVMWHASLFYAICGLLTGRLISLVISFLLLREGANKSGIWPLLIQHHSI